MRRHAALALLFLALFVLDLTVAPRQFLNYRDSLEIVTSSAVLQAAHPPGFPLLVILARLLSSCLFFVTSIYTRYAIVNSLFGLATLFFVYCNGVLLTGSRVASALATCALGLSYSFWLYRIIPEVFMLANLASMVSWWLLLRWRALALAEEPAARRWWLGFCFSLGVGLACHQTTLLWWPGFAWLTAATLPRSRWQGAVARGLPLLLLGTSPFLLVWPLASRPHYPLWGNVADLRSFFEYLLRSDYGGLGSPGAIGREGNQWRAGAHFADLVWFNFGPLALLPLAGILRWRREPALAALLLTLIVAGPVFLRVGLFRTDSPFYLGSSEPLFLPSFIAFTLASLVVVHRWIPRTLRRRRWLFAVTASLVLVELTVNHPRVDRSDSGLSADFHLSLLGRLPPRSVLIVGEDRDLFAAVYSAWTLQTRPDIAILSYGFIHKPAYRKELAAAYSDLSLPAAITPSLFLRQFLRLNVDRRPIFLATLRQADLWGVDGNPFFLRPMGKLFEVVRDPKTVLDDPLLMPFSEHLERELSRHDFWELDALVAYRQSWLQLGKVYAALGLPSRARSLYAQAMRIDPLEKEWPNLAAALAEREDDFAAPPSIRLNAEDHDRRALAAIDEADLDRALFEMELAVELAPQKALYANKLAVLLVAEHDFEAALPHAERAVALEPANAKFAGDLDFIRSQAR